MHILEFAEKEKKRIEQFLVDWVVSNDGEQDDYPMDMDEQDWIEMYNVYEPND